MWTKYVGNPVMDAGPSGSWDDWHDSARRRLSQTARPQDVVLRAPTVRRQCSGWLCRFVRTASRWTMLPEPVLEPSDTRGAWDATAFVYTPLVIFNPNPIYHMWYAGTMIRTPDWRSDMPSQATASTGRKHATIRSSRRPTATTARSSLTDRKFTMWYAWTNHPSLSPLPLRAVAPGSMA